MPPTTPSSPTLWVTLPTYNESGNIESLIRALLELRPDLGVVVIDDHSPDGTWKIVEGLEKELAPRVVLIHRTNEKGRGSAGVAGFRKAVELGARFVVEMDADWSHHPRFIAPMLAAAMDSSGAPRADIVVGSRLVSGGGETGRSFVRTLITYAANFYIKIVLGLPIRDCTTGYRIFSRRMLERVDWPRVDSNGPAIVQEMLICCRALGGRMVEVPILFEPRRAGQSTFNARIALQGLTRVIKFRLRPAPILPGPKLPPIAS